MQTSSAYPALAPSLQCAQRKQGGLFTAAQALAAGYSSAEISAAVRSNRWTRLGRGVFAQSHQLTHLDRREQHLTALRAALLMTDQQAFASHRTAAIVHGLPLIGRWPDVVDLTQPSQSATRVRAGVKRHAASITPAETGVTDGLPCLTISRTVADLGRSASFNQGVVIADAALRGGVSRAELESAHRSSARWPGARQLDRVISFARAESESAGESLSRIAFAAHGLPPPSLQVSIYDCDGLIGRCDFLWEDHLTIAEFDGRIKYASGNPDTLYLEKVREDRLRDAGYEVVRFGWRDIVERPQWVVARIEAAFARHARRRRPLPALPHVMP